MILPAIAQPVTLEGQFVRLVPLSSEHHNELIQAVSRHKLWELWYTRIPDPDNMETEIQNRLAQQKQGKALPFTVVDCVKNKAVGMTGYVSIDSINRRVEIGPTWYPVCTQRTQINTEAKLLLFQHAFEHLRCIAVELQTHYLNLQSRRAIERLGAKLDGVLRNHIRTVNGALQDTCVYSIIESEWPAIKTHLQWQLKKPR